MLDVWLWNETLFFLCVFCEQTPAFQSPPLPFKRFEIQLCFLIGYVGSASIFRCGLEQSCFPESFCKNGCVHYFCMCACVCALCLCTRIVVCNMCVAVFYLHSKDLIKVSRLTQQLMVNLASFSHSPTHDLSIFPTVSDHIQACCCSEEVCIYSNILMIRIRVCWDENDFAKNTCVIF